MVRKQHCAAHKKYAQIHLLTACSHYLIFFFRKVGGKYFFHSFIHPFSVDLLQDMEIVIFIIIQEKNKTAAYSIYVCKL
jgi:hypothetical protein